MSALTAAREDARQDGVLQLAHLKAGAKIFKGGLVAVDASGYAVAAIPGAKRVIGVAFESADNTSGANDAVQVRVWKGGVFDLAATGLTVANQGDKVYVTDDNTVTTTATGSILVGVIEEFVSATKVRVNLTPTV